MKPREEHGNGTSTRRSESFTTQVIDENPYLQSNNENGAPDEDHEAATEDEFGAPSEKEDRLNKVKQRRRRLALIFIAACLFGAIGVALLLYRRMPTRVEYGANKRIETLPSAPTTNTGAQDSRTEKAIAEARRLTDQDDSKDSEGPQTISKDKQLQDTPFTFPSSTLDPNLTSSPEQAKDSRPVNETSARDARVSGDRSSQPTVLQSQRNSETSLYMVDSNAPISSKPATNKTLITKPENDGPKTEQVTLPTFGSMLPVQTIGSLYTLRAGALVRLQLTRDVNANGWSMKRGTVLVGTTKGSDLDRAFVSLVGFIEPRTNKLLKLNGDILGGDGAQGLKGKRRQIDVGWSRVLSRLATSAAEVTGAFLNGRNRDTVIISDGVRTRTINPITNELSGVLGNELERDKSHSFVEIDAGTPGYVLVTDLPSVIQGTESIPEPNDNLSSSTDDAPRSTTGLTERELADLLANGSPEQIKAAMPRMSPEMRKIAEAVLRP